MSRRTRLAKARARATVPASVPAAFDAGGGVGNDGNRGTVIFPYGKSKDVLKGLTRREGIRLSRWATLKVGSARFAIRGLASRVGVIALAANTTDDKFNEEHAQWWDDMYVKRAGNFDATGKFTAPSFTRNAMCCTFRDGGIGIAHVTSESGEPQMMAIGADSITSSYQFGKDWHDGVQLDGSGRHLAYAVTNGALAKPVIISAADMYYLANLEDHDSVHGTPLMFAALDRIRDGREIDNAAVKAAKIQSLIALWFKRELGAGNDVIPNLSGKVKFENLAGQGTKTTANYGAPSNIPRRVQEVFDDAEVFDGLGPGVEPRILNDGRDFSAQTPLKHDIYNQMCWAAGVDPRAILNLEGLTGPDVRRVLSDFQKWREEWQALQLNFLVPDYLRKTEWAIRTRQIRRPSDPRWYSLVAHYPAAATIDAGRDASAQEKKLDNALTTLQIEYGEQGEGWKPHAKQWLKERKFLKEEGAALGLTPAEIFKKTGNAPPPGSTAAAIAELKSSLQLIMEKLHIA